MRDFVFYGVNYFVQKIRRKKNSYFGVRIKLMNKKYFGGYFTSVIDAAKKYNEMALKYHGEFAFLNKIPNE